LKIFITGWYILRSIALRGLINSWLMLKDEKRYERYFGIITASLKKSSSHEFFHYQGASYRVLFRIFSQLPEHVKKYSFFDIGCGKGRAVFVAEHAGFDRCTGVEIDQDLVITAKQNAVLYHLKRPGSVIHFEVGNALEYNYESQPTVYFLFNPFNEFVLRQVVASIISKTSEETWFVYMNPRFPGPFHENRIRLVAELKTRWYTEALIFCHQP
jgi:SAM-dependent methyltransferase